MLNLPMIIQGGMGVAISNWKLAKAVSLQGQLGVISGTGVGPVLVRRLQEGDGEGAVRRALSHFPFQAPVQKIVDRYFAPNGTPAGQPYKSIPIPQMNPSPAFDALTVIANFVEVFLAKEGHNGMVGINLLEKVQLPNMASLYGAMLAGVDAVLMGAGIPIQIAGILDKLALHQDTTYRLDVLGADKDDDFRTSFSPEKIFPGIAEKMGNLKRPLFFPIISSVVLAQALIKRSEGAVNGFIIEGPLAGGHNAPPRGTVQFNEVGEPIYTDKDKVDLDKIRQLGLPFFLAGRYGHPEQFQEALSKGAAGVQIGTAFAFSTDSGMDPKLRESILHKVVAGTAEVYTSAIASPTGFPFKVVQLENTASDQGTYEARQRICDMSFLRHLYKKEDGTIGYRCPAEPVEDYVAKGGKIEDTVGRVCLCNGLAATAGSPQRRRDGYSEIPIVTAGNDLVRIGEFFKNGSIYYSAKDVIDRLMTGVMPTAAHSSSEMAAQ